MDIELEIPGFILLNEILILRNFLVQIQSEIGPMNKNKWFIKWQNVFLTDVEVCANRKVIPLPKLPINDANQVLIFVSHNQRKIF